MLDALAGRALTADVREQTQGTSDAASMTPLPSTTALMQPVRQGVDWTQLPEGCRVLIVQHMDSLSKAAWRTACRLANQDVHAATHTLRWCGQDREHLLRVPHPLHPSKWCGRPEKRRFQVCLSLDLDPPPTALTAVTANLPSIYHLNCSGLHSLTSIQGIPATLRSLDLNDCYGLDNMTPLQYCTALESLKLTCGGQNSGQGLADTLPPALAALSANLRHLRLSVFGVNSSTAAEAVVRSLEPLNRLQELYFFLQDKKLLNWQLLVSIVGQMTDLQELALGNTGVMSTVAPAIRQLRQLRGLGLTSKQEDGTAVTEVAKALVSLPPMLTKLSICRGSDACSDNASALSAALHAHAATLRTLKLSRTVLGDNGTADLAPGLRSCTALTKLDLSECAVSAAALATALIGSAHCLTHLDLCQNYLMDDGTAALAPALSSLSALVDLNYCGNEAGPAGAATLAAVLSSLAPSLTSLDVSCNHLEDEGAVLLTPALTSMTALVKLGFSGNCLGPAGAATLAAALPPIAPSLTYLDVSNNDIGDDGAAALAPALRCMTGFTRLDFCDNIIGPAGAAALASALPLMTRLQTLDLNSNPLRFEGLRALSQGLQTLSAGQHWTLFFFNTLVANNSLRHAEDAWALAAVIGTVSCVRSFQIEPWFPLFCGLDDRVVKLTGLEVTL